MRAFCASERFRIFFWSDEIAPVDRFVRNLLESRLRWEVCGEPATIGDALRQGTKLNANLIVLSSPHRERAFSTAKTVLERWPSQPTLICTAFETVPDFLNESHIALVQRTPAEIGKIVAAIDRLQQAAFVN